VASLEAEVGEGKPASAVAMEFSLGKRDY